MDAKAHVKFDAPAILRKWPSRNNQRYTGGTGPYLLVDGTLDECIREFMAKIGVRRSFANLSPRIRNHSQHAISEGRSVGVVRAGGYFPDSSRIGPICSRVESS